MKYQLQNRYQDGGWENLDEQCIHLETAKYRAYELSKNSIAYGMVRVVNIETHTIEAEYTAGGEAGWKEELPKPTVQFFNNEEDTVSRESVRRLAESGYSVVSLPTSGPPAIWVEGYEVVGRTAIGGFVDNLIKKAAENRRPKSEPENRRPKSELWQEYTVHMDGLTGKTTIPICGLCGNTGYVSTLDGSVRTPNGYWVPIIHLPCICPNGRAIKAQNEIVD